MRRRLDAPPPRVAPRTNRRAYSDGELAALRETDAAAYNRILGNRRSAASSKARRDALLKRLREENARLREENARLLSSERRAGV